MIASYLHMFLDDTSPGEVRIDTAKVGDYTCLSIVQDTGAENMDVIRLDLFVRKPLLLERLLEQAMQQLQAMREEAMQGSLPEKGGEQ